MVALILLFGVFVLFLAVGVPIFFSMCAGALAAVLVLPRCSLSIFPQLMATGINSFVLLAIPTFIAAGMIMEGSGMAHRLMDFARATVGWIRGGAGMTTIGAEILFSGVSGSTMADVSAIGSLMASPLVKSGYQSEHAASIISVACASGILIPPAVFMIVIGTITDTSVIDIFLAGIIPCFAMTVFLVTLIYINAHRLGWPKDSVPSIRGFSRALKSALLALGFPILILGGLRFGFFTATEAGAIAFAYAVCVGVIAYRSLSLRKLVSIIIDSGVLTAVVVVLIAVATVFQYVMARAGVTEVANYIFDPLTAYPPLLLLVAALIAVVMGMVLEGIPAALIYAPVLFPIATSVGIHPVHFCIVMTAATGLGAFLPPVGIGLLIATALSKTSLDRVLKVYGPYMLALLIGLVVVVLFPQLSLVILAH